MTRLFSSEEEARIIDAIREAEQQTSGEVRVHVEKNLRGDAMKEAVRTFRKLGMHRTAQRNGVLIFLAPERRELAIIGDEGIDALVGSDFWNAERDLMLDHFRRGEMCAGVCAAIAGVGEKLKAHFPFAHDDSNELTDEISYGH